jgi:hypothetical protein
MEAAAERPDSGFVQSATVSRTSTVAGTLQRGGRLTIDDPMPTTFGGRLATGGECSLKGRHQSLSRPGGLLVQQLTALKGGFVSRKMADVDSDGGADFGDIGAFFRLVGERPTVKRSPTCIRLTGDGPVLSPRVCEMA